LNPGLIAAAVADAYHKLLRVEAPNLAVRNRAQHCMLVDGVNVECVSGTIGFPQPLPDPIELRIPHRLGSRRCASISVPRWQRSSAREAADYASKP